LHCFDLQNIKTHSQVNGKTWTNLLNYVKSLTAYDGKIYQWVPAGTPELASEHLGENRDKSSALQCAVSKKYKLILFANVIYTHQIYALPVWYN
jgi:hypothetical protein